jgi:ATP-binding cassette, subfamily D (ALD), member 3
LIGIIIPKKWSAESGLLLAIAGSLIARSVSDIWMIQNATVIESAIITMNRPKFRTSLVKFLAMMPAVSFQNQAEM